MSTHSWSDAQCCSASTRRPRSWNLRRRREKGTLPLRCMIGTRNCGATSEELVKQSNNFGIRTNRQHVARRSVMTPGMKLKRVPSVRHEILANNGFANCDHLICNGGDIQSHRHTCIYAPVRRSAIRAPHASTVESEELER